MNWHPMRIIPEFCDCSCYQILGILVLSLKRLPEQRVKVHFAAESCFLWLRTVISTFITWLTYFRWDHGHCCLPLAITEFKWTEGDSTTPQYFTIHLLLIIAPFHCNLLHGLFAEPLFVPQTFMLSQPWARGHSVVFVDAVEHTAGQSLPDWADLLARASRPLAEWLQTDPNGCLFPSVTLLRNRAFTHICSVSRRHFPTSTENKTWQSTFFSFWVKMH